MSQIFAVLTGDLVGAAKAQPGAVDHSISILTDALQAADWAGTRQVTRFCGDGWQVLVERPEHAMRLAVVLVANLASDDTALPTRIGIGVGDLLRPGTADLSDAAGPCFQRSMQALTDLKRGRYIGVAREGMPRACQAIAPLLDALSQQWTASQAAPMACKLKPDAPAQIALAQEFGITAQSLNRRLHLARWREIEAALRVVEAQPFQVDAQDRAIAM
jgi:hypothetical protein